MNVDGFMPIAESLEIRLKRGGVAPFGSVMHPNQRAFMDLVVKKRRACEPIQFFWIKARQFAAMSTTVGAVMTGDIMCNDGYNAVVTAQNADSLDEISQIYRHFFGRTKKRGVEQKKAERMADRLFVSANGSRIKLQVASEDLGRSGSLTSLHVSEAGYIDNFTEAWRSIQPAMSDGWGRFVVMETTLRRNQPGDFRDVLEATANGEHKPWEVHFTPWYANPELTVHLSGRELVEFQEVCPPYERALVDQGLKWGQARWYYDTRVGGMFGSYEAMMEAYPSSLHEALKTTQGAGFFTGDALKFYKACIRPPVKRMNVRYEGLVDFEEGDSPLVPHVELWDMPTAGHRYRIGADCADADERIAVEGSENAAVLVDEDTGDVVGVYHGYSNAHEFAQVLYHMGKMFNDADLVIESNNAGRAVIDHLRSVIGYHYIYKRETFRYGRSIGLADGLDGFDTRGNTRGILLDRLQMGVNSRLWGIPSEYLYESLKNMAKRDGRKAKSDKNEAPDDGAIALGLTGFGHDRLIGKEWRPKQPYVPVLLPQARQPRPNGIRIMGEERKVLRFDPRFNCWR